MTISLDRSEWKALRLLLLAAFCSVIRSVPAIALPAVSADEAQIRAAMVFNLTRYVEWPAWKFTEPSAPFVLCFLANDAVGDDTDALLRDRQSHDRPGQDRRITVRRIASPAATESCHVLYASRLDRKRFSDALPVLGKWAVLTISDSPTAEGAVISLPTVDNRVQIFVDLKAAQESGLTLSSKLLKIATVSR